jgi:hypothetical protein
MSNIVWKAVVFFSLVASALFVFELALMWSLMREQGVQGVLDRRFEGGFDIMRELSVLAISVFWIRSKIPPRKHLGEYQKVRFERPNPVGGGSRSGKPGIEQSSDIDGGYLFEQFGVDDNESVLGIRSLDDNDIGSAFSESNFDDSFEDSINPANGMPMVGCMDIEGNAYGTDSNDVCFGEFDNGLSIDLSDSLLDDDLHCSDDSWI